MICDCETDHRGYLFGGWCLTLSVKKVPCGAPGDDGMEQAGMGIGIGDYNLDGHLDVFKTQRPDWAKSAWLLGSSAPEVQDFESGSGSICRISRGPTI